mgnify:FL=1
MITIEDKIKLFYKLLNQSMDTNLAEDLKELETSYESKLNKEISNIDKEAEEIEEKAAKKAEIKRAESISKSKVIIKKDIMALKEKYYYIFMDKFNNIIKEFVDSGEYEAYLSDIISKLSDNIKIYENCDLVIYVTKKDNEKFSDFIRSEINKKYSGKVLFKTAEDILGGLVAELSGKNVKIDMSMDAVLEENKIYIMQTIFEALEAGDYNV